MLRALDSIERLLDAGKTAEALLRPWVGDAVLPDLPIPYLVTVRLDPAAPASAVTLGRAMAEAEDQAEAQAKAAQGTMLSLDEVAYDRDLRFYNKVRFSFFNWRLLAATVFACVCA